MIARLAGIAFIARKFVRGCKWYNSRDAWPVAVSDMIALRMAKDCNYYDMTGGVSTMTSGHYIPIILIERA